MPYTPPTAQSPASSKSSSPVISRTSSYHEDLPRSPTASRPQPPRSMSSASYMHKHRRSPSLTPTASDGAPPTPTEAPDAQRAVHGDFVTLGSLRQSPPPLNNLRIPTGAVISPPDSSENSDSDESANRERGRVLEKNWGELQLAVRAIPQQRSNSPDKTETPTSSQSFSASEPTTKVSSPGALSAQARKISHSRSSTETKIMIKTPTFREESLPTTDDSDEEEDPLTKPALVRKKSGELVKPALRPSSRRRYSSMPGTPTYSKSVHFNDSDNQTRHFLQVDKPIAVSAGTSPVETYDSETEFPFEESKPELGIRINNFPEDSFERRSKPIRVERIKLSPDKTMLMGTCAVQNLSFQKLVVARFTLDYWNTTSEVVAEYNNVPPTDGCDRFNFNIKLTEMANVSSKTMLLCMRYNVGGQEFWDNNNNTNYQIDFMKVTPPPTGKSQRPAPSRGLGQRPLNAIPRSRHTPPISRHNVKHESLDDDFATRSNASSAYDFVSPDSLLGEPPTSIRLKPKSKRSLTSDQATPSTNAFGSRYDFGSSLSAALTHAQDKLGRGSGLMSNGAKPVSSTSGSYFGPVARTEPSKPEAESDRPDALSTDRPAMGSDQYRDLVQKFCYFTSGTGAKGPAPPIAVARPATAPAVKTAQATSPRADGTDELSFSSSDSSASSSPMWDGAGDRKKLSTAFLSCSASPSSSTPSAVATTRTASPVTFAVPFHLNFRDGYLSDARTQTAIHG